MRAVVRQSLPEVDPATFLRLVDCGEGGGERARDVASTPLRMCRYAGNGGVAFGETSDMYSTAVVEVVLFLHLLTCWVLRLLKEGKN